MFTHGKAKDLYNRGGGIIKAQKNQLLLQGAVLFSISSVLGHLLGGKDFAMTRFNMWF